ncbi:septum site-determining protein MinC [Vreelandella alkaliphila]|uniref:Probable septum site-determining protein MinC n=1 Tax=Vreelandella alkaliphila TaxID=272774 RepID=A0A7C9K7T9_9GAMM|nr:septum site-determining protein MinC [Halomonas alkaliphila]NDL71821.1 septum site-determining protein MinC [Halomonas alkaliphila]
MSLNANSADIAFTFKGGMLPMTVMELSSADPEHIRCQLSGKLSQSPAFFQHTPVVLSVEKLDEPHLALERICAVCRDHKLLPVAVRGGAEPVRQSAWALGLGWFAPVEEGRSKMLESVNSSAATDAANEEPEPVEHVGTAATRLFRGTVRSGQQVSAAEGDLIVIGAVNAGAEVLAAGSIHIYGALRGRALAGIHGNTQSGIYCRELEAELLSVAGNYKRLEDIDSQLLGRAAEVHFAQEQLEIKPLV